MNPHPPPVRRLYRASDRRLIAGVAGGIAAHLGLSVVVVRVAFIVLASVNGLGAVLYAVFWAVVPADPSVPRRRRDPAQLLPYAAVGLGVLLLEVLAGQGWNSILGWLVAVVAVGAGVIWHQADPRRRHRRSDEAGAPAWVRGVFESDRRSYLLRFIGGGVLVVVGIIGILVVFSPVSDAGFAAVANGLLFAILALAGVGVATAPVLWRMFGQLRNEREARIREQERAELAAMIHDQVLHTLALIQRNASDVKSVLRLARGQERTLRNWLYRSTASPAERFAAALEEAAAEVEDTYAIAVETVVVGDREVDERTRALVAATREAMVNAARHAKVATISLYAEVEPELTSVFVRDRGVGFDVSTVEEDRHGVRGSIIGRMKRHGGKAEIRSELGAGTEVRLTMPSPAETRRGGRVGEWLGSARSAAGDETAGDEVPSDAAANDEPANNEPANDDTNPAGQPAQTAAAGEG
jgi:signal transduction histidine kinase/phage shock protein PspC (stress-responsive transcriptional regulator)